MIASERSIQDLSEAILTLLTPCEGIVKFRYTLLVIESSTNRPLKKCMCGTVIITTGTTFTLIDIKILW